MSKQNPNLNIFVTDPDTAIPSSRDEATTFIIEGHTRDGLVPVSAAELKDRVASLKIPDLYHLKEIITHVKVDVFKNFYKGSKMYIAQ